VNAAAETLGFEADASSRSATAAAGGGRSEGLVHSKQSSRDTALRLSLDTEACQIRRARRCQHRTITAARLLDESCRKGSFRGTVKFITLTYRDGGDWQPQHVRRLMNRIRSHLERRGHRCHFAWTAELQGRGAIHYHAIVWLPQGCSLPYFDKAGWWPHGSTRIETADNPVGYIAKYASKIHRGLCDPHGRMLAYPKGARICGSGGLGASRARYRYWTAPKWAREAVEADHGPGERDLRRHVGGWVDVESGTFYESPWRFIGFESGGGALLFQLREVH
jgi:hypothetical protein